MAIRGRQSAHGCGPCRLSVALEGRVAIRDSLFPAGTKFQRVEVPTDAGRPSIAIPLWVEDSAGRFRTQSGTLRFLYGYVRAADGVRRFGWMAQDALEVSATACP